MLDDDLGLLRQVVLVQRDEVRDGLPRLRSLVLRILGDGLLEVKVRLVRRVRLEHVMDEAFTDRLPHRVQVEGVVSSGVRVVVTEELEGAAFGRRGDRKSTRLNPVTLPPRIPSSA